MRHPIIQFLYFRGCPLAAAAREALEAALAECGIQRYEEIDILDRAAPENLRGWGSPTILIDGIDASGASRGDAVGCRVYATPTRVPEQSTIVARIRNASTAR